MPNLDVEKEARVSLERLLPRIAGWFPNDHEGEAWRHFERRLHEHFGDLFALLLRLYGDRYDFFYHLEATLTMAARMALARPDDLRRRDLEREQAPLWYRDHTMLGAVCYVDLFAGTLRGLREKIPYIKELGVTYLHLMPLFEAPEGNNDGGYAVSSYRRVDPRLGTMEELADLAGDLRHNGISLALDFVFNHTSDEHLWARRAQDGDEEARGYYYVFPDRTLPDLYGQHLRDIFPDARPGSFTYRPDMDRWVWTTFNSFQWDLNYTNPAVFTAMAEEMLFLANHGAEVLRLDAVAFAWKQLGTPCESLPEVHVLVRAFNAMTRIAAPATIFKSEAIVHPAEVNSYLDEQECQISYNPLLMALLWETLATREVRLLLRSMQHWFHISSRCAWVDYVRSHDDIGWTFDDGDAASLGMNGYDHRRFLNAYFAGRFPGSFAQGVLFQENPRTGDARVTGACASLAGLERALRLNDPDEIERSIRRIVLLYSIVLSIGGMPLIYLGDEIGLLNDYSYLENPDKAGDSRWVNRPTTDWDKVALRHDPDTVEDRIYGRLTHLIALRKAHPVFGGASATEFIDTGNGHIFAYLRERGDAGRVLILANVSEHPRWISIEFTRHYGLFGALRDMVTGRPILTHDALPLEPYQFVWLAAGQEPG